MEFLSGNLPLILCGIVGYGLLLAEAFMPGFGIAGILGILLEIFAIYTAWVQHGLVFALVLTVILIAVIGVTVFLSYRSAMKGRLSKSPLVLKDEAAVQTPAAKSLQAWVGLEGVAVSALRPGGTVEIGDTRINAASDGDLILKGTRIRVIGTTGDHVIVCPAEA